MSTRWVTTNVRIDPRDYADLQRLAAARGDSLAECLRIAVSEFLGRPRQTDEVQETAPLYGEEPATEVPALVRGATLVLEQPLPGVREGARLFVRVLGEAEVAQRKRHRRVIAELLAEFEALPPGKPGPVGSDDREIYKP